MKILNFFKNLFNKKDDAELIAQKYGISFERGLSVDGLSVADFNYLAQSYSRKKTYRHCRFSAYV